jgi:hypothetical protein
MWQSMHKIRLAFLPLLILTPGLMLCIPAGPAPLSTAHAASKAQKAPPNSSVVEGEDIPIEGEGPKAPMAGGDETGDAEPQSRPVPPTSGPPAPVTLAAMGITASCRPSGNRSPLSISIRENI